MLSILECPLDVYYGVLWKPTIGNSSMSVPCNEIHTSFRKRLYVTRKCSEDGIWMPADLSSCTVDPDLTGLLMLSFLCSNGTVGSNIETEVQILAGELLSKHCSVIYHDISSCIASLHGHCIVRVCDAVGGRNTKQFAVTT